MLLVLVLPPLSVTVSVTVGLPAVWNVWLGVDPRLLSAGLPSPQFQVRVVIVLSPSGSELKSAKLQGTATVHGPPVKLATGSLFGPVPLPPSPPQAHAAARMTVVAAIRGIDRIESSQPRE